MEKTNNNQRMAPLRFDPQAPQTSILLTELDRIPGFMLFCGLHVELTNINPLCPKGHSRSDKFKTLNITLEKVSGEWTEV